MPRSYQPLHTQMIRLGRFGEVAVAEMVVFGALAGLVTLIWSHII